MVLFGGLWATNGFAWRFFGTSWLGVFVDLMLLAFCSLLAALVPAAATAAITLAKRMLATGARASRCINAAAMYGYIGLAIFALLLVPHLRMSHKLAPLKTQFDAICEKGPNRVEWRTPGGNPSEPNRLDFSGRLEGIIKARNQVLAHDSFVMFGGWRYTEGYPPSEYSVYIYTFGLGRKSVRSAPSPQSSGGLKPCSEPCRVTHPVWMHQKKAPESSGAVL